jgi:proline dehydrogenase
MAGSAYYFRPLFRSSLVVHLRPAAAHNLLLRRGVHNGATTAGLHQSSVETPTASTELTISRPLSIFTFPALVRSYIITGAQSIPSLLDFSIRVLNVLAHSESALLNPDRNIILRYILKKTIYAQFCAGENEVEVKRTVDGLRQIGFHGVMLGYAKEVVRAEGDKGKPVVKDGSPDVELETWLAGTLKAIDMTTTGDFVSLKFSGAGNRAIHDMLANRPPNKALEAAMTEICDRSKARGIRLLFDAEQHAVQAALDRWTLDFQQRYNGSGSGEAIVYGTYQAYLRSTPGTLVKDLAYAAKKNFTLGVKLVRGAYMGSDPRHLFWSNIQGTNKAYDGIIASLLRRQYNDTIQPPQGADKFPKVDLVMASHNLESVRKAIAIREEQARNKEDKICFTYGQLQGMADHISGEIVLSGKAALEKNTKQHEEIEIPQAYKYLVWGSVSECVKYLLRRAEENRDAAGRTHDGRKALGKEIIRRILRS